MARRDFWNFCLYLDEDFFQERRSVLREVAYAFQEVEEGELDLLYVGMPPRTGKSYITSLFCCWSLGRNPKESIMRNTVTAKLYSKFSDDIREIMKGETHQGKYLKVFPQISFKTDKIEGWKLATSRHGISYFGAGVGGSIIGFGCTKAAILDDSIKNAEEALSANSLDKKWNWYTSTHKSRLEKGCPEIHIATRWSKGDIPGRLIKAGLFASSRAKKIVIPALVEGKSFCEAVKSTAEYLKIRNLTDEVIWQAEYMQQPVENKGLLMPLDELKTFKLEEIKGSKPAGKVAFIDTADEGNDYLSCVLGYIYDSKIFIVDVVFTREATEVTESMVANKLVTYDCDLAQFESNNGGKSFARNVARILKESNYTSCIIHWQRSTSNKETRIIMQSGYIKRYFYFRSDYQAGSQYDKFMRQLTSYSKSGGNKHDDANDSVTGLAELVKSKVKGGGGGVKAQVI